MSNFRLGQLSANTAMIMCEAAMTRERELHYVAYEEDGPVAVCDLNHSEGACDGKVVAVSHLFNWEPGLEFLKDLEFGQYAWKNEGVWEIRRLDEGDTL